MEVANGATSTTLALLLASKNVDRVVMLRVHGEVTEPTQLNHDLLLAFLAVDWLYRKLLLV